MLHLYNFVHSLHNSPSQLLSGAHNVLPNPLYYETEQQQQSIYIVEVFNKVLKKKNQNQSRQSDQWHQRLTSPVANED